MTNADRVRILQEARARLETSAELLTKPYVPPDPQPPPPADELELGSWPRTAADTPCTRVPLVSAQPLKEWKADAIVRKAAKAAADARRRREEREMVEAREQLRVDEWLHRSTQLTADVDDKIAKAITAEREFVRELLTELTAHFQAKLRELDDAIRELRQEQSSDKATVIDLPGPLPLRRRIS
jgi:hypothetical protein